MAHEITGSVAAGDDLERVGGPGLRDEVKQASSSAGTALFGKQKV